MTNSFNNSGRFYGRKAWLVLVSLVLIGLILVARSVSAGDGLPSWRTAGEEALEDVGFDCQSGGFYNQEGFVYHKNQCQIDLEVENQTDETEEVSPELQPALSEDIPYAWIVNNQPNHHNYDVFNRHVATRQFFGEGPIGNKMPESGTQHKVGDWLLSYEIILTLALDQQLIEDDFDNALSYSGPYDGSQEWRSCLSLTSAEKLKEFRRKELLNIKNVEMLARLTLPRGDYQAEPFYCVNVAYKDSKGQKNNKHIKVSIPAEEFRQQKLGQVDETDHQQLSYFFNLLEQRSSSDNDEPSDNEDFDYYDQEGSDDWYDYDEDEIYDWEDFDYIDVTMATITFRNAEAKSAYYVANPDQHPCSLHPTTAIVIEANLFIAYSDYSDPQLGHDGVVKKLKDDLVDDNQTIDVYDFNKCQLVKSQLKKQIIACRTKEVGYCRLTDNDLIKVINQAARNCQKMYEKFDYENAPSPADLADCLQLKPPIRQDFIETIQIINKNDDRYADLLEYGGFYDLLETKLPYVLWDGQRIIFNDEVSLSFELGALHEYLHKVYYQDLTAKQRMRLHQEILALLENKQDLFIDYLGQDNLAGESYHKINRHDSASQGLNYFKFVIDLINDHREGLLEILPDNIKKEYAEFLKDRHGLVAFYFALAETYTSQSAFTGINEDNLLQDPGLQEIINRGLFGEITEQQLSEEIDTLDLFEYLSKKDGDSTEDTIESMFDKLEDFKQLANQLIDTLSIRLKEKISDDYKTKYPRFTAIFVKDVGEAIQRNIILTTYLSLEPQTNIYVEPNLSINKSIDVLVATAVELLEDEDFLPVIEQTESELKERLLPLSIRDGYSDEYDLYQSALRSLAGSDEGADTGDESLMFLFKIMDGLFSEAYPILGLETSVRLSDWLEEHYNRYFNRESLSAYFRYYPLNQPTTSYFE